MAGDAHRIIASGNDNSAILPHPEAATAEPRLREMPWSDMDSPARIAGWDALAAAASEPNPFFESWYLLPSLRAFDPQGRVRLLVLEAAGMPLALMPVVQSLNYYGRPLPHWRNWTHANCFLGCPLVADGAELTFARKLLDWADETAGYNIFLHLAHLPLSGRWFEAIRDAVAERARPAALVFKEERAMLASDLSPEAYWDAALSGKKRKEIRRQYKRLSEEGCVEFRRERNHARLERWIEDFLTLEASGWKGAAGSALACSAQTSALFRDALNGAAALGRIERLSLMLDDKPIAMLVNFLSPPGCFSYKTAFDETYARFSPGVLLQRENLALLGDMQINWCDSCATADHPMIDHIWRERRAVGRVSIGIGGPARRALFRQIARLETGKPAGGMD